MTTRRELFALSGAALVASAFPAGAQVAATPQGSVNITQIRNATLHIVYGGVRFLVDPMLSDRHSWPGFKGSVNSEERNPLVHLPMTKEEIIDVDAVIVTHLHEDHWDEEARKVLPKTLPIFAQNDADAATSGDRVFPTYACFRTRPASRVYSSSRRTAVTGPRRTTPRSATFSVRRAVSCSRKPD